MLNSNNKYYKNIKIKQWLRGNRVEGNEYVYSELIKNDSKGIYDVT